MNWTKDQLLAINEPSKHILVSAGAGSGKTAVLTARVINMLNNNININQLLILTFTKAAAVEMKERIRRAIIKDDSLHEQLNYLDEAYITTFDSYCLSLVKKYHYLLNVNNNIKIVESSIMINKKHEIMDNIFLSYYEEKNQTFLDFISTYTTKDDFTVQKMLLSMYEKITLINNEEAYLKDYFNNYHNEDYLNNLIDEYDKYIQVLLKEVRAIIDDLALEVDEDYHAKLISSFAYLNDQYDYDNLVSCFNISIPRLPNNSSDLVKSLRDDLKNKLGELEDLLIYENKLEIVNSLNSTKDFSELLCNIFLKFKSALDLYKAEYQTYEYIDVMKMAIYLVINFSEVKEELKETYQEILVDEYQDTNDLQELFINTIANNNLYLVGDIKQSIYAFRNANPLIFQQKYYDYSQMDNGLKIDLMINFRSNPDVVNSINTIFNPLMTNDLGGANYKLEHQMIQGNSSYEIDKNSKDIEVLTYHKKDYEKYSLSEKEIFIIINDIKTKVKNKYQVVDLKTNTLRDIKYSDFTILIDRSTDFDLYKKIFEYEMIPLNVYADEKLTNNDEFLIIKNILKALVKINLNEHDQSFKYLFTSIARSYLIRLSDEEIFDLITNNTYFNSDLYQLLKDLSYQAQSLPISSILELVYDEFKIYEKMITTYNVEKRHVSLSYLMMLSKSLEDLQYDLNTFANYLEEVFNNELDIKYSLNNEQNDAVTLMTIHKSKGLEFNVCYFPSLTKRFNLSDLYEHFIFSKTYGIIMPVEKEGLKPTIKKQLLKRDSLKDEISERIRLFYVALTRTKQQIVLVMPEDVSFNKNIRSFYDLLSFCDSSLLNKMKMINLDEINLHKDYDKIRKTNLEDLIKDESDFGLLTNNYVLEETSSSSFSKKLNHLLSKSEKDNINLGLEFHYYLENINFKNPDFSLIPDQYKSKIVNFFNQDLIKNLNDYDVYQEYKFMDEIDNVIYTGIIDLLVITEHEVLIIDYKLSNVEDEDYLKQLQGYQTFMQNKTNKDVKIYLYSILKEEFKVL